MLDHVRALDLYEESFGTSLQHDFRIMVGAHHFSVVFVQLPAFQSSSGVLVYLPHRIDSVGEAERQVVDQGQQSHGRWCAGRVVSTSVPAQLGVLRLSETESRPSRDGRWP